MAFFWTKTLHLVFVIAWMAAVFYLPRILVNIVEAGDAPAVRERLVLMGRRLYRFGHVMFGLALAFGATLAFGFRMTGGWLHAKIGLVLVVLAFFIACGRWLKRAAARSSLPSGRALRLVNEIPVLLLVAIVYLVVAKPF